ncbi:SEC-C metal-binding domain-containing protein [Mesorhizobium sp. LNHC209A00]|uniref:SEC-C metal-binding domain-containing protein n=1 Tax=Mesorhizobium TaxID=68287 RepID=UPI0003CFE748|nr:SEC-C metal-binding domain-containing protein [Mesorhizobium sp. LNHC209A00]ESY90686.1 hypothetical protein X738_29890 [Mesorhizobium sp. LNHC209A00]
MLTSNPKPDDPCTCKSGKRYADCHGPIVEAPKGKAIFVGQKMYAKTWAVNAQHYDAQGLYGKLAAELAAACDFRRVLDIGCGLGQGLKALAEAIPQPDRLIVGIDENPDCLKAASDLLAIPAAGAALGRIKPERQLSGYYASKVATKPLKLSGDLLLVHVDMMVADPAFEAWLDATGPFDAITLWFSGVHPARSMTKVSQKLGAKNDADLREALEDRVMEFTVKRLRAGGVLQMVQRFAGNVEAVRQQREAEVLSGLASYPFELVSVRDYIYSEPDSDQAMTVDSVFIDLSGHARFALSILMRRNHMTDDFG